MITAATYQAGVVTVSHSASSDPVVVTVNDVTDTMRFADDDSTKSIDEGSFETKAKKYEARDFDSYSVVLAGSSSMENWSTSTEDMDPVTTKNVGIGGSSSVHWLTLADRLIIPYTPRAVVLYVGINDIINYGSDGETATPPTKLTVIYKDRDASGNSLTGELNVLWSYANINYHYLGNESDAFVLVGNAQGGYQTIRAGKSPAVILVRDGSLIPHVPLAQRTDQIDWNKVELKAYKVDAQKCTGLLFKPGDKAIKVVEQ